MILSCELLPYIDALIKEVYRLELEVPLGVPRELTQDDVYEGIRFLSSSQPGTN